jgi:uncharacterized membrane protein (UPF0182 family)
VAFGNNIAMEETLEKSLGTIFGSSVETAQTASQQSAIAQVAAPQQNIKTLISEAGRHYEIGQQELKKGNWAGYGAAMQKVEQAIKELSTKVK